jgi:putative membrane protein
VAETIERLRAIEWMFILPLLAGIAAAILLLAGFVETQLDEHPVELAGLFVGLVAGAVAIAWLLIERPQPQHALVAIAVAVLLFAVLGVRGGISEDDVSQRESVAVWAFFLAGAVAICAMILPGISGSLLLVLVGMYGPVLDAVSERDAVSVAAFLLGATLGLALFSQLLHWALERHHDLLMAALVGLMVGSVRVLWPWPDGLNGTTIEWPSGPVAVPLALAMVGMITTLLIGRLAPSPTWK